jgi:hypothetical protein
MSPYAWHLSIYLSTGLRRFFSFLILHTHTPTGDQSVAKALPAYKTTQTQNIRTQTSMPWVGFEHTIPAFEREKTHHVLDRAASWTSAKNLNKDRPSSGRDLTTGPNTPKFRILSHKYFTPTRKSELDKILSLISVHRETCRNHKVTDSRSGGTRF